MLLYLIFVSVWAQGDSSLLEYTNEKWKLSKTELNYLKAGKILSIANVKTLKEQQTFILKGMALHAKKCSKVLRKLSQFENYSKWISFINKSTYQEKSKLFTIRANHTLLPFPMLVHIIVDRPSKIARYPFSFPTGIFKGLSGYFEVKEFNKQCFVYGQSFWRGKKTKIPDIIIEIFSETLTKIGGEILMRKVQ